MNTDLLSTIRSICVPAASSASTDRQAFYSEQEIQAREKGHVGFAEALHVLRVMEQYGLGVRDAQAFIQDQRAIDAAERNQAAKFNPYSHFIWPNPTIT